MKNNYSLLDYMINNNFIRDGQLSVTTHYINGKELKILWEYSYIYGEIFRQFKADTLFGNNQDIFMSFLKQNNIFINCDLITKFIFVETLKNFNYG